MHEDRQQRLAEFTAWCDTHITGDEKGEAQLFLDRLFQAFGQKGLKEAGATLEMRVRKADAGGTTFADLVWKPIVLIEMKKRGIDLSRHYRQAFDYWTRLVPGRPRFVVLCNFDEFWVYDFETQMDTPLDKVILAELPKKWGPLAFLFPEKVEPTFGNDHEAVTRKAADLLAQCFNKLIRRGVDRSSAQRFTLQMLVSLFSQNIGLLEQYFVTRILAECKSPSDTFDLLGGLFTAMNTKGISGGRFKGVDYFNGGLFAEPAQIELEEGELKDLQVASTKDWSQVRPEIFGTLFEHSLGKQERHAFGAHFTSAVDIMKIVSPTIVEPWRDVIENATSIAQLNRLLGVMHRYRVLDPACGSGNFLYIAYRELKRLEAILVSRIEKQSKKRETDQIVVGFVTAEQFFGLDINPFAVELAKVTMMIARKLAIDELHTVEPALPLDNLDKNFRVCDALIDVQGDATSWPQADVIIGNPPFLDARKLTVEHGREYANRVRRMFPDVPGRADYCVYWFHKAQDQLPKCGPSNSVIGRAGLVGTNTIRQNNSRPGSTGYIVEQGGTIVDAVSSQVWSGEASVHVSIVNWANGAIDGPKRLMMQVGDSRDSDWKVEMLPVIPSSLSFDTDVTTAHILEVCRNPKRCFEGQQPGHKGFTLNTADYRELIARERTATDVTFPYAIGTSILSGKFQASPPHIIDFGERDLLSASAYPLALGLVKKRVLAKWEENAENEQSKTGKETGEHQNRLKTWWCLKRRRGQLLEAIAGLPRYFACVRLTKRPIFFALDSAIHPDSSLTVFAFADDYSFGILQSDLHWQWFLARCSTFKRDWRYTSETVFDSFPWPQSATAAQIDSVSEAARNLRAVRASALGNFRAGLRGMYRTLELPGNNPLKEAHRALDAAVLAAYGFTSGTNVLWQLLRLNSNLAARIKSSQQVIGPGVPPNYPQSENLVTDDCIRSN